MIDFKLFEIGSDIFLLSLSIIILLVQFFLCFKVKNTIIRLIPIILFLILTVVFLILIFIFDGWDSIGCLLLAICSFILLVICGIGWLVWLVGKKRYNL